MLHATKNQSQTDLSVGRHSPTMETSTASNSGVHSIETNCRVCGEDLDKTKRKQGLQWVLKKLQRTVQAITYKKSVKTCSSFAVNRSCEIKISTEGSPNARFTGLNSCLNTTICPPCAHRLGVERAKKITSVAEPVMHAGGSGMMLTLTIPHLRKDNFKWLNKNLNHCWHALMRQKIGKHFGKLNKDNRPLWVRSWDYTWSINGDHVHLHCLVLFENTPTEEHFKKLEFDVIDAWLKLVKKNLKRKGSRKACKVERVYNVEGVAKYNNKIGSVAFEIASSGITKTSKKGSLNIWELIWAIQTETDPERKETLIKKFRTFEKQTTKLRTISFSKSFREKIEGIEEELEEEENNNTKSVLKIRADLFKLVRKADDTMDLLDLFNAHYEGDISAKPVVEFIERICDKYNDEQCFIDEEQMEKDWGVASFRLRRWSYYRFRPEHFNQPHRLLIEG